MEKIRIKSTGKVYETVNKEQIVDTCCSSNSGYVSNINNYEATEKTVDAYYESGYDEDLFQMNNDRVWRLDGFHYCEGTA